MIKIYIYLDDVLNNIWEILLILNIIIIIYRLLCCTLINSIASGKALVYSITELPTLTVTYNKGKSISIYSNSGARLEYMCDGTYGIHNISEEICGYNDWFKAGEYIKVRYDIMTKVGMSNRIYIKSILEYLQFNLYLEYIIILGYFYWR